jgi:hypothetical protein
VSLDDDVTLAPLLSLKTRIEQRMEMNERHAGRHPDPYVRSDSVVRVRAYRLVLSEIDRALDEAAKDNINRILAERAVKQALATKAEAILEAQRIAKVT